MKKIIVSLALIALLLVSALLAYKITPIRDAVASLLPLDLKVKIKRTLFEASVLREDLAIRDQHVRDLNRALEHERALSGKLKHEKVFADLSAGAFASWPSLAKVYSQSENSLLIERTSSTITASDGQEYEFTQYPLPFLPTGLQYGYKPLFYVDSTQDSLYLVTGDGVVFKTARNRLNREHIELKSIPSNIRKVINDAAIFEASWFSIKDLKILNGTAYISYTKKVEENYTLAILSANLEQSPLVFEEFFVLTDPVSVREPFNAHQIGGRIVAFKDNQLLVSTGDFRKYEKAQANESLLGKIFALNLDSKETQIVSKGHRNVQGLDYDPISGAILSTEHGPNGGDEINLNLNLITEQSKSGSQGEANFGWPMASYGLHYDSRFHEDAPLHKSHKDHGFIEPLKQFTPSVGMSEIVRVPNGFLPAFRNDYFAATMGLNASVAIYSLHHFRMDASFEKITYESIIKVGERIRDLEVLSETQLLLGLEGNRTPSIGLLSAK